jgi:hypothetical protein
MTSAGALPPSTVTPEKEYATELPDRARSMGGRHLKILCLEADSRTLHLHGGPDQYKFLAGCQHSGRGRIVATRLSCGPRARRFISEEVNAW